jgi:hypothetical protein
LPFDVATRMGLSYRTSELTGGIMVKPPSPRRLFEPLAVCVAYETGWGHFYCPRKKIFSVAETWYTSAA